MPNSIASPKGIKQHLPILILVFEFCIVALVLISKKWLLSYIDSFAFSDRLLGYIFVGTLIVFAGLSYTAAKCEQQGQNAKPRIVRRLHFAIWGLAVVILAVCALIALLK